MHKTFKFNVSDKERQGIIGDGSYHSGKVSSKSDFKSFYHADVIFAIDGDGCINIQKNRFLNRNINLGIEKNYLYINDSSVNFPYIEVYNDNGLKTNTLLNDPISIDLS